MNSDRVTDTVNKHEVDLVIFGANGDLCLRKLMPACYRAHQERQFADGLRIIAVTRRNMGGRDSFIAEVEQALVKQLTTEEFCTQQWNCFAERIHWIQADVVEGQQGMQQLSQLLSQTSNNHLFYFALPPSTYGQSCLQLAKHQLIDHQSRVILEKPIGYNRESAEQINQQVAQYFTEQQIYRIDHYLGKETVQNLMVLRFSNFLFEQLWDNKSISHVQISLAETVGLEGRAGFYDKAGAVRDMVQNHLLQLLCLVAMEPASELCATQIRQEKVKVLRSLRPIVGHQVDRDVVSGQYTYGEINGTRQISYQQELGQTSNTETYVAIKAHIDNWRWAGVPFYLRTGKCLNQRCSEIVVQFKPVSHRVFHRDAGELSANRLVMRLQPDEDIKLELMTKDLNQNQVKLDTVHLNLNQFAQPSTASRDAYKRLILDAVRGDSTLFIHREEIDASWQWLDPILHYWQRQQLQPLPYAAGSWGPEQASQLLAIDSAQWHNPDPVPKD